MIDTARTMRELVMDEPELERFLQGKGFPFTVKNPITKLVTLDDVIRLKKLNKETFLNEYQVFKETSGE